MWMIRDISFYKRLLWLVAPLALQNVITYSVSLADNMMVGQLGELSLSAVFVSNQVQNILHMLVMGLSAALIVLAAQYWGNQDRQRTQAVVGIALRFGLTAAAMVLLATVFWPRQILRLFTDEEAVIEAALPFLSIVRWSYLFFCLTQILIAAMRCVETVKIAFYLSLVTLAVNVSLNWLLIFGNLGFPALGLRGAAIATLAARIAETTAILSYVVFVDQKLRLRLKNLLWRDRDLTRRFVRYGLPVVIGDITWGINIAVQGAIIGRLGATALASVSIANVIFSIIGVAVYGTAGASAVIIGQAVGSGDIEKVKQYARTLQGVFLVVGVLTGLVMFALRLPILSLYDLEPDTLVMARQLLTVLSIMIVGTSYQMSTLTGIVRAGGATHFVLLNDLFWIWVVIMPSAFLAAFVFEASPVVVFAILKADQILKCGVAVVKVNRFRWIKNLTTGDHSGPKQKKTATAKAV